MADKNCLSSVGLAIGLPFIGRPVSPEWAISFSSQNYPMNIRRSLSALKGEEIGKARNKMVHAARQHGAKYLWFLDDDVAPPFHAIRSLITTLENASHDVMVAGGIYCAKTLPTEPVVFRGNGVGAFWQWKHGDVFECTGIGTGCMLIKMEVFDHLPEPWFKTIDTDGTPEQPILQETDDMYFCDAVIDKGFKILADTNVMCIHWGYDEKKKEFIPYMLPADSYPMRYPSEEEPRASRVYKAASVDGNRGTQPLGSAEEESRRAENEQVPAA